MPWYVDIIGSVVRAFMVYVGARLVDHHVLTDTQAETLSSHVVAMTIASAPIALSLAWSIWQKYVQRSKLAYALAGVEQAVDANQRLRQGGVSV